MTDIERLHRQKVTTISRHLRKFYKQNKKIRVYHGSTNSTRTQKFNKDGVIDISDLNQIIKVDINKKYIELEPNVSMDRLVAEALKYNLIPPVVMEFPGITVGGGIQGGAGESSSFKWGLFHHTAIEYEIVLGNGKLIAVSAEKNSDIYWGTACSYGSLGIITKVKLNLIPAEKFVCLTYLKVENFSSAIKTIEEKTKKHHVDFIDGILFSKNLGVIMVGKLEDGKNLTVSTFRKAVDDWFYLHARKIVDKHKKFEELIPLKDYLFRYNRGAFWVGHYAFVKGRVPFNRFTRFLFDPLFQTRTLYRFLQAINISQRQIVQDFCLPKSNVLNFLEFIDKTTHIYPLWLCPGWSGEKFDKLSPGYPHQNLIIDIGVWGKVKGDYKDLIKLNERLEKMLTRLEGRKVLYAHSYYPRDEFWKIYDHDWYKKLRRKYYAENVFPDVYEKTKVSEEYKVSMKKGLLEVLKSPFKLPLN